MCVPHSSSPALLIVYTSGKVRMKRVRPSLCNKGCLEPQMEDVHFSFGKFVLLKQSERYSE